MLQTLRETELKRIRKKRQQINFVITEARFICEIFTISDCTFYKLLWFTKITSAIAFAIYCMIFFTIIWKMCGIVYYYVENIRSFWYDYSVYDWIYWIILSYLKWQKMVHTSIIDETVHNLLYSLHEMQLIFLEWKPCRRGELSSH